MNLLLFGPPGAGKGTQSQFLVQRLGYRHFSTGDLFRAALRLGTRLGLEAKGFMERGELVPDRIVIGMVEEEFRKLGENQAWILDGFPRTVPQGEALEDMLQRLGISIGRVVFLTVRRELLIKRLSGRRMTADGKYVYNIEFNPPKMPGVCDVTGEKLIQRDDDREDVVLNRLKTYEEMTEPLKQFYAAKNRLSEVKGEGDPEVVHSRILELIQ